MTDTAVSLFGDEPAAPSRPDRAGRACAYCGTPLVSAHRHDHCAPCLAAGRTAPSLFGITTDTDRARAVDLFTTSTEGARTDV